MDEGWRLLAIGMLVALGVTSVALAVLLGSAFLLLFALPLLVVLAFLRRTKSPDAPEPARARATVVGPVETPTDADLADLPWPVTACPRCGFLGVRAPGIGDGLWPGGGETGARFVCPRCDFQGIPIEFEEARDYVDFVKGLTSSTR